MKKLVVAFLLAFAVPVWAAPPSGPGITAATSVGTTAGGTTVLEATPRVRMLIQNIGSVTAICAMGATPTSSVGFQLAPGQVWSETSQTTYGGSTREVPSLEVKCITGSSSTIITSWYF